MYYKQVKNQILTLIVIRIDSTGAFTRCLPTRYQFDKLQTSTQGNRHATHLANFHTRQPTRNPPGKLPFKATDTLPIWQTSIQGNRHATNLANFQTSTQGNRHATHLANCQTSIQGNRHATHLANFQTSIQGNRHSTHLANFQTSIQGKWRVFGA